MHDHHRRGAQGAVLAFLLAVATLAIAVVFNETRAVNPEHATTLTVQIQDGRRITIAGDETAYRRHAGEVAAMLGMNYPLRRGTGLWVRPDPDADPVFIGRVAAIDAPSR